MRSAPPKPLIVLGSLSLLTLGVCARSPAQQSEAAPSAPQTRADVFAEDARLSQKATAHVEGLPLNELLARLSQQAGVSLRVQQDIGDEKVVLFASARPLRDLLSDIAMLRNDTWMRQEQPGGKPVYRLVRNARAREYESELLERMGSRLKTRLDEQVRALAETPEQRNRRLQDDPIRERLSDPRGHMGTQFYALLDAAQRQSLFARDYFDVPYTALHPDQQTALRDAFVELNANTTLVDPKGNKATGVPPDIEHSALRFHLYEQGGRQSLAFGFEPKGYGLDGVVIASMDNRAEWLLPPHGNPYTHAPVSLRAVLPPAAQTRGAALDGSAPDADAAQEDKPEANAAKKTWMDRLSALAAQTGTTICADFYRCKAAHPVKALDADAQRSVPSLPHAGEGAQDSIAELDAFCRPAGYLWWMQGKTLMLRKRDWFEQRVYETPDAWTLDMAKRLRAQQGVPTYGDALRLLDLTTEQIAGLMSYNDTPHGEWYGDLAVMKRTVSGSRELLAVWNAFPNSNPGVLPGREPFKDVQTFTKLFQQSTRSYAEFTEQQRGLAWSFVNGDYVFGMQVDRRSHPVTELEMAAFRTRLVSPSPNMPEGNHTKKPASALRAVPIELSWWMEGGMGANQCRLFLPAALPDDRRAKTVIEIMP